MAGVEKPICRLFSMAASVEGPAFSLCWRSERSCRPRRQGRTSLRKRHEENLTKSVVVGGAMYFPDAPGLLRHFLDERAAGRSGPPVSRVFSQSPSAPYRSRGGVDGQIHRLLLAETDSRSHPLPPALYGKLLFILGGERTGSSMTGAELHLAPGAPVFRSAARRLQALLINRGAFRPCC